MSDGRVEAGFGAGWNDDEHAQLGLPFPALGERFDLLEEQMAIIHGLWTEPDGWSFDGEHWQVRGRSATARSPAAAGAIRTSSSAARAAPRLAGLVARYGDEFNLNSASPDDAPDAYARVRAACTEIGRDPDEVVLSAMTGVLVAETEADLQARVADLLAALGQTRPTARRHGSRSVEAAGSWARPSRRSSASAPSRRTARSGSCSRTSSRATSTTCA